MNKKTILPRQVRLIILASAVSALFLTSGCILAAVGVGAAGVGYVDGSLAASLDAGLDKTARAANAAVKALEYVKVSENKDALSATLVARNGADTKIEIKLETTGENITKVTIRVGVFGDKALSLAILDKIKANL